MAEPIRPIERTTRLPVYRAILYTLWISLQVAWDSWLGRVSIERCDRLLDWWSSAILRGGRATLVVEGREHLQRGQPYVFMSNHRSILDIPVLYQAVPGTLRMVAKEELSKVPVWGQALKKSGFVLINRNDSQAAIQKLNDSSELLQQGVSIWISPEGTRSRDGNLLPFKKGGFMLALRLGIPIVPVFIDGSADIIPADNFLVQMDGHLRVRFGRPIPTRSLTVEDRDALMERVRTAIEAMAKDAPAIEHAPRPPLSPS